MSKKEKKKIGRPCKLQLPENYWDKVIAREEKLKDKLIDELASAEAQSVLKAQKRLAAMLDKSIDTISDIMDTGTAEDQVRLKAAIWTAEVNGCVKTTKSEVTNKDGDLPDKEALIAALQDEMRRQIANQSASPPTLIVESLESHTGTTEPPDPGAETEALPRQPA